MMNVCEKRLINDAGYFEARYMRGGIEGQSFYDEAYTCCQLSYLYSPERSLMWRNSLDGLETILRTSMPRETGKTRKRTATSYL